MVRVALGQMKVTPGRPEVNLRRAENLAQEAAREGAHLLLLPELWLSGHDMERAGEHARSFAERWQEAWSALARRHKLFLAGSAIAPGSDGRPANVALMFSPEGEVAARYEKIHLFAPMGERCLAAGRDTPCFDLPWGRTALAVCYDLRFPELFRRYVAAGAAFILLPAAWPRSRLEHWRILLRARAIENQCFLLACNRAGRDPDGTAYAGHSTVLDPGGHPLCEGGWKADLLLAELEPEEVTRVRSVFPVLADRCLHS
ncbi:MAG: nitrilase-related carbon-nitrogen hydrolase [Chloroflexia bacterium]